MSKVRQVAKQLHQYTHSSGKEGKSKRIQIHLPHIAPSPPSTLSTFRSPLLIPPADAPEWRQFKTALNHQGAASHYSASPPQFSIHDPELLRLFTNHPYKNSIQRCEALCRVGTLMVPSRVEGFWWGRGRCHAIAIDGSITIPIWPETIKVAVALFIGWQASRTSFAMEEIRRCAVIKVCTQIR